MRICFGGLWRHPDFVKLWLGRTVSLLGSQVTGLALPLVAVTALDASPFQVGLLTAAETSPVLVVGLVAGVWADRVASRRRLLIVVDIARAAALCGVPLAAWLGTLRIEVLYAVGLVEGTLSAVYGITYQAFLPSVIPRERLVEGNSKLEASSSATEIAGPPLAGALVQSFTAPVAVLVDAMSFVVSALTLALIQAPEASPVRTEGSGRWWRAIGEGVRFVLSTPALRAVTVCTALWNLFEAALFYALFLVFATRTLGMGPGLIGLVYMAGNAGFLLSAVLTGGITSRIGVRASLLVGAGLGGLGGLFVPLAGGPTVVAALVLVAALFVTNLGAVLYVINQSSLRQAITPDRLQGRMNATVLVIIRGVMPAGALLGGALAEVFGLRPALAIAACGQALAFVWLLAQPRAALQVEEPRQADSIIAGQRA